MKENPLLWVRVIYLLFFLNFSFILDMYLKRNKTKKDKKPKGYWNNIENRRKFFIDFAKQRGFDPFKPENWAHIARVEITKNKVKTNHK